MDLGQAAVNLAAKIYYPILKIVILRMKTKDFLKEKAAKKGMETALLSESVLAREWLGPEEEEAWKDL